VTAGMRRIASRALEIGGCVVEQFVQQLGRKRAVLRGRGRAGTCGYPTCQARLERIRKPPVGNSSLPVGSEIMRGLAHSLTQSA
jgi:hypothetical protein